MPPRLPEKIYFKIGEVSEIVGVEPYVLRYWETEFDLLKPSKAPSKHRLYKKRAAARNQTPSLHRWIHNRRGAEKIKRSQERRKRST